MRPVRLRSRYFLYVAVMFCFFSSQAQTVEQKIRTAFEKFESDGQLRYASTSLYVIDLASGAVVFDRNSHLGLAPASTQKIITSVTAYELLGRDFRYSTQLVLDKTDDNTIIRIMGSGDPSFGSWRWEQTNEYATKKRWVSALKQTGINKIDYLVLDSSGWNSETVPDGWIWQDIGNYYGAGASLVNWRENQFDIILRSGDKLGDPVTIVKTVPQLYGIKLRSEVISAAKGTGDNAYVYYPFDRKEGLIRGTIPLSENQFRIAASIPSAIHQFVRSMIDTFRNAGIKTPNEPVMQMPRGSHTRDLRVLVDDRSPALDSLIYWFNRRSINLYGEALVKTFGSQTGRASTDSGIAVLKRLWKGKGWDVDELNMHDGSGLSPLNRVTTHIQVQLLKYAREREWYPAFYHSLPEYNGMKMKSGTISDVKGFCGYHKSREGREYVFSFLVNNYSGRSGSLVTKMYKVLDELK